MSFSDFLENEVLDHLFSAATYAAPATLYVALSTTTPADDGTNVTEPAGGSYARQSVANNATQWPAAVAGSKSNGQPITFVTATGSWGTITHFALYDAVTSGNMIASGALGASKTVDSGDTASFAATTLVITLD